MSSRPGSIGARVRAARRAAGLTEQQLADVIGVSQAGLSLYELGHCNVSVDMLVAIANHLHRPIGYFLGLEQDMTYLRGGTLRALLDDLVENREDLAEFKAFTPTCATMRSDIDAGRRECHGTLTTHRVRSRVCGAIRNGRERSGTTVRGRWW